MVTNEKTNSVPAWLCNAVFAALPATGESRTMDAMVNAALRCPEANGHVSYSDVRAAVKVLVVARLAVEVDPDHWCRAPTVPHAEVQAMLAQRASAEDAPFLYAVYQAVMRVREAQSGDEGDEAHRAIEALLDSGKVPADPRDEEIRLLRGQRARSIEEFSMDLNALRDDVERLTEERDGARRDRDSFEELATTTRQERDAARAEIARLIAGRERVPAGHRVASLLAALYEEAATDHAGAKMLDKGFV